MAYTKRTEHIGAVTGLSNLVKVNLSLSESAYADGDLLADAQEIADVFTAHNQTAILHSIVLLDKDDQGEALDLYFTNSATSWGTENAAGAPSDAVADDIQGHVSIAGGDYNDLTNSQIVTKSNLGIVLKANSSGTSLYVAAISRGTGTYSASGIQLTLGLLLD